MLAPLALENLKSNQRQLDMDGCEVGVSRQALEELIAAYEALSTATPPDVAGLVAELEDENYRHELQHLRSWQEIDRLFQQAATALRLSAGGGVPEGWKLVPVDPTPEMLGAFWRQKNCGTQEVGKRGPHTDDCSAYRAMLAASPTVEAGHVE